MAITGATDCGRGLLFLTVDADPTVTAVDAPAGSLIAFAGVIYRKQTSGSNVDSVPVVVQGNTGGGVVIGSVPTGAGTGSALQLLQVTTAQRDFLTAANGMSVYNTTLGMVQTRINGAWVTSPGPSSEVLPIPESRVGGNATRIAQTSYEGCSYLLSRGMTFDRLILNLTGGSFPVTVRVALYQAAGGISGVASLVATCDLAAAAAGTHEVTPAEGTVHLSQGIFFVLFGRVSGTGSGTFRTFTVSANELLNSNVPANVHPVSYTTALAIGATAPATFDPRRTPTGQASASVLGVAPILRLRKT